MASEEEEEDYDDEDFEEEEFPDDFEEEVDSASECSGDPSEEEAQPELEDSEGAHSQSVDPATTGDLVDAEGSQEYAFSENAEEQAVGDPSEEEAQRDLADSEASPSQSVDPATNGDLVDAEESQEYADSENAEGQAVGDLAEDAEEDQEVQQEPEDNEMEHREAADSDTMIGQQQEVTQEPGDIDIHAEEVGAATISGDLPAEANEEEPEQQGPGDAPEEATRQELHEHESADVQAGAETMRGEVADVEHDQVVQQRAPEASGHVPEEPKAEGEAPETSHTSAPELLHSLLMESSLGSRHWSQLPEGHVAVGRHREIRVATAPSKLRRRSPGREGREGKDRPARAKREAFSIVKLEPPEQRSASWVKAPEEPWTRRAPQRIKQAYCGSLVMLPKLKKPPPAETTEPGPANAQSSTRKGAAPRASPAVEREPFEPRQLQDFLSSASADIWRYYFPEQKPSDDVAIGAG